MSVAVIIVNYRTADLTCACLHSLQEQIVPGLDQVIVVDNDSRDGSHQKIASAITANGWKNWVDLQPLDHNGGFAYGNNKALEFLFSGKNPPKYIWFLNPDTIVRENACRYLSDFLDKHSQVGISGSRLEDFDNTPQVSAFRHHSVVSELLSGLRLGFLDTILAQWLVAPKLISSVPHQADWVAGASMMVRREVFEQIGLLDERYFMYYEEEDFCKKATDAGWQCWYVPKSRVVHLVGAASGFSDTRKKAPRRPPYWFESRRRFFLQNYGRVVLVLADAAWLLGFGIWSIRRMLQGKPDHDPPFFLKDFFSHSVFRKGFQQ